MYLSQASELWAPGQYGLSYILVFWVPKLLSGPQWVLN